MQAVLPKYDLHEHQRDPNEKNKAERNNKTTWHSKRHSFYNANLTSHQFEFSLEEIFFADHTVFTMRTRSIIKLNVH